MRGKGELQCAVNGFYGITPAYAGKSIQQAQAQWDNEDHPRLCGEKFRWASNSISL